LDPDPLVQDPKARLKDLRNGLLRLHSVLLASERHFYEHEVERIPTQGRFLDLVLNDPAFAWLRELSQLVVIIDETLEAENPPERAEADALVARSRRLLSPGDTGGVFETRYLQALQRDPNVVMAHAAALKLLRGLE
jgi:hypothetical protein